MFLFDKFEKEIGRKVREGKKKFVFYPFGRIGFIAKRILNDTFTIREEFIIDNKVDAEIPGLTIKRVDFLKDRNNAEEIFIICSEDPTFSQTLEQYVPKENILDIFQFEDFGDVSAEHTQKCKAAVEYLNECFENAGI